MRYPSHIFQIRCPIYGVTIFMRKAVDLGNFGEYLHYGMPLALTTVLDEEGRVNVATVASMTPLPGEPPRLVLGIFEENRTSQLIARQKEFALNFVTSKMRSIARTCGIYSGRDVDKLKLCDLHLIPAQKISTPLIRECPLNIECRVTDIIKKDGLNLFIAEIVTLEVADELSDGRSGVLVDKLDILLYAFGSTMARGPMVGHGAI